jgi:glycosyltransferase involved in cell wall biosynthesis
MGTMNLALSASPDLTQPRSSSRPTASANPALSIITPYYNTGAMFFETAVSLLRQTFQQWEWIIVNDGSDDPAALRVLDTLRAVDDPRVRLIDQPNRGLPAARNAGAAAARAPLLFFLDSDDVLAPTALEKLAWTLESYPEAAFATAWVETFGARRLAWRLGFDTRHAFLYANMATALTMVRRSVFAAVGGFDEARRAGLEDYEFWLRCAAHGYWGRDVHEFLLFIRRKAPQEYTAYRWATRDDPDRYDAFRAEMRARYPRLFRDGLPVKPAFAADPHPLVRDDLPFENRLARDGNRRILLLLPRITVGGADRFALDLAAGLAARGDRVTACLLRDDQPHDWLAELQRITPDVFNLGAFLATADIPRFLRYLSESRGITHLVLSNALLGYQLLPYLRARCPQVAVVDVLHMEQEARHGGFPRVAIEYDGLIDLHITSTDHLRQWMIAHGAPPARIAVCTTNIDPQRWAPDAGVRTRVRRELGIAPDVPVILYAARLTAQKRPRLAAEIVRRLRDDGLPFVALIAGDGEDAGWMRRFVRRWRLSGRVRLLGAVPHERVRDLLLASDLLLLPSAREGLALILFEALATGVVPVAADVGGQRELVTPECGVLIPTGGDEAAAYVAALRDLITAPERRAAMARAGRARIEGSFTLDAMIGRMQTLLDRASQLALDSPRPPVPVEAGLPAAALAIEHFTLEQRLRRLPPVRIALALRHSSAWAPLMDAVARAQDADARLNRAIYEARREIMKRVRRAAAWVRR